MAVRRLVQSLSPALLVWGVVVGACVASAVRDPGPELRHPAVAASAAATVAWVVAAWLAMVTRFEPSARLLWGLGWLTLLVHLTLAFGVGHGWSHAAAVEHVREVGGYGEGIVVNYLFALVWGGDVVWWYANPAGRRNRRAWVSWSGHGFLAFVVVNAAVVFGPAERRIWYAAALGVVGVAALLRAKWGG